MSEKTKPHKELTNNVANKSTHGVEVRLPNEPSGDSNVTLTATMEDARLHAAARVVADPPWRTSHPHVEPDAEHDQLELRKE